MKTKNIILAVCVVFITGSLSAQTYIGAKKCKMCHNKPTKGAQYKKWSEAPHSKAYEILSEEERKDAKCLKCHSTAASLDEDLRTGITIEEGVSCESCHGAGSKYKPSSIMKSREKSMANGLILPTKEVCIKCHNDESPHYKGFDYDEAVKKIAHPNPDKEE